MQKSLPGKSQAGAVLELTEINSLAYWLTRDPQGVAQALNEMLRK